MDCDKKTCIYIIYHNLDNVSQRCHWITPYLKKKKSDNSEASESASCCSLSASKTSTSFTAGRMTKKLNRICSLPDDMVYNTTIDTGERSGLPGYPRCFLVPVVFRYNGARGF